MPSNRRSLRFGLFLAAAIASAGAPRLAHAADTPQDRAEAKRLYSEGKKLRSDGKHADALDRFRRAHELMPTPVTRLEVAIELEAQKKLVEAHALLVTVEAMPVTPTETQKGKVARDEAKALAAAIEPRIPRITLVVTPASAETKVAIDGRPLSNDLLTAAVPLDPGAHTVSAQQGAQIVEQPFTLAEGERRTVELTLPVPETAPPPPEPVAKPKPAPIQPVVKPAPQPAPVEGKRGLTPVVPVAFAIGGLGIATGIVTGSIALSQAGTLKTQCAGGLCPPEYHDLLAAHQALATTSTVAFALGGAGAAAGVVAWIVDVSSAKKAAPKPASIQLRWMGTGIAVNGTW